MAGLLLTCTGCTKSQDRCLNFERIYLEYYYRYNGKIKIYSRFGYGKSIAFGFSSVSIVILKIYTFKVQTAILTFCTPCSCWCVRKFEFGAEWYPDAIPSGGSLPPPPAKRPPLRHTVLKKGDSPRP